MHRQSPEKQTPNWKVHGKLLLQSLIQIHLSPQELFSLFKIFCHSITSNPRAYLAAGDQVMASVKPCEKKTPPHGHEPTHRAAAVLTTEVPEAFGNPWEGPRTARAQGGENRGSFPFVDRLKAPLLLTRNEAFALLGDLNLFRGSSSCRASEIGIRTT